LHAEQWEFAGDKDLPNLLDEANGLIAVASECEEDDLCAMVSSSINNFRTGAIKLVTGKFCNVSPWTMVPMTSNRTTRPFGKPCPDAVLACNNHRVVLAVLLFLGAAFTWKLIGNTLQTHRQLRLASSSSTIRSSLLDNKPSESTSRS
jgi:hypothetical protein